MLTVLSSSSLWEATSSQLEESDFCRCLLRFEQGDSLINVRVCFAYKFPDVPSLRVVIGTRPIKAKTFHIAVGKFLVIQVDSKY